MTGLELLPFALSLIVLTLGVRLLYKTTFIPQFARPEAAFVRMMRKKRFPILVSRNIVPVKPPTIFIKTWRGVPPQHAPLIDESIPTKDYVYSMYGVINNTERLLGISIENKHHAIPEFAITPHQLPLLENVIAELFPQLKPIVFPEKEVFNEYYSLRGEDEEKLSDLIRPELMNYLATLTEGLDRYGISARTDEVVIYCRIPEKLTEEVFTRLEQAASEVWQYLQPPQPVVSSVVNS